MPTDEEYLENAGLNEAGESKSSTPEQTTTPTPEAQSAVEMFELGGNKFPVTSEFNIVHDGKTQKLTYNDLANGWRRATHYQQKWDTEAKPKLEEFNTLKPKFDEYKGFFDKYGALQKWSEENPQDWKRLEEIWKNKDQHLLAGQTQPGQPNGLDPIVKELSALKSQFNDIQSMKQKIEEREQQETQAKDIDFVKNEITEFQKEFPEIDLNEKDPEGVPLWAKITQWGTSKGFIEYTPAAMMYLKPRIAEIYSLRARTEAMKSAKQDHSQGIVKRSTTPFSQGQSPQAPKNVRNMSYAEIAELAKNGIEQAS